MQPSVDERELDRILGEVERARAWSPRLVSRLEGLVRAPDDATLVRVNPLAFARERGVPESEAIDLFLHAAKAGLFSLDWHLLCPSCGMAVESFGSLRTLHSHYTCELCQEDHEAQLDDYIQVSFTISPKVRRTVYHDLDALPAEEYLRRWRFTRESRGADGTPLTEMILSLVARTARLAPGATERVDLELGPGGVSLVEVESNQGAHFAIVDGPGASRLALRLTTRGLETSESAVAAGPLTIELTNELPGRATLVVAHKPAWMLAMEKPRTVFDPFLRGSDLLTNQTFRQLFRTEVIAGAEGIGIRDVTVLFTDLKGSTEMYGRIGDLKAFTLVRQHFDRIAAVVQRHGGAIVKTIGDAVMAAFSSPAEAVRAALRMRDEIDAFNREHDRRDIVLKIGLHRGASIAVTLNENLDYFGQTVNIAARVQGLADADEIWLTDDVLQSRGVADVLAGQDVTPRDARLRGIEKEVRVHRVGR